MLRAIALLLLLGTVACASTGAVPRPFPGSGTSSSSIPPPSIASPAPHSVGNGYAIAGTALSLRGVRYRNGGNNPDGFDCSGFVWYVFGQNGVGMPRTVAEQYRKGADPGPSPAPGDLVFFSTTGPGPTHVGILIGGDQFVHAPSSSGVVRVERLSAAYWGSHYLGARRVTP